jgi:hypothetical protein
MVYFQSFMLDSYRQWRICNYFVVLCFLEDRVILVFILETLIYVLNQVVLQHLKNVIFVMSLNRS